MKLHEVSTMKNSVPQRVYIVLEDDRGAGVNVVGVFSTLEGGKRLAIQSSHYYIDNVNGNLVGD